jgi:hypothetical protein
VSVLKRRIHSGNRMAAGHPFGTGATPMEMPLAAVHYDGYQALYQTLHPLITADGAVVPGSGFRWPDSVPLNPGETESYND